MPKIAIYKFLVFYLYSYDLNERLHLHISKVKSRKGRDAKIFLDTGEIFERGDLTSVELSLCRKLIKENQKEITKIITKFAKGEKIKPLSLNLK
jgi:hypothetical protein